MLQTRHRVAGATALVVLSLLAGCSGSLPVGSTPDAATVGDEVEQRYAALEGYSATVTRTVEVGDNQTTTSAEVTVDTGDRRRVAYTAGPRAGTTVRTAADAGPVFDTGAGVGTTGTPAVYGALAETLVAASDVTLDRVTTRDGRRTAVLTFEPASNASAAAPADLTRTVWVDLERRIPLQVETTWTTAAGQQASVSVTYDDVTLFDSEAAARAEVAA
jgi:outer membrane lipoprotein-sorting protein